MRNNHKPARCHPGRRHAAKGLCFECYNAQYPKARRAECHPDRVALRGGLCRVCYDRHLKEQNPEYAEAQARNNAKWVSENRERNLERVRKRGKEPRVRRRDNETNRIRRLAAFGLTSADEQAMLDAQGGACGICGDQADRDFFDLDHDHNTGTVRGLLCARCNKGLGLLGDDLTGVLKAVAYLKSAREKKL